MSSPTISSRIAARMEALGLSFVDVASKCSVSPQAVRNWCKDADRIYSYRIATLARALKCSITYLLGLSNRVGKPPA